MENQYSSRDELTLKELILAIQDYSRYFLRKWYWFVLGALTIGALFVGFALMEPVNYDASLTFMLNDEKESSVGAGTILGNLGLGKGEVGGNRAQKLLALGRSRQVVGRVLFDSASVDGTDKLIADHLLEIFDYDEIWEDYENLRGFRFGDRIPDADDRTGNQVFKSLHKRIVSEEGLMSIAVNENTGLFTISVATLDPALSIALAEGIYRELSEYFVNASVSGKEKTLQQLKMRSDSVETALAIAETRLARFEDRSGMIPLPSSRVQGLEMNRQVLILSTMYAEIVKNRETAAFLLASEKPAFNLVDNPLEPLQGTSGDVMGMLVIGVAIGIIVAGIILFMTKLVNSAMEEGDDSNR